MAEEVDVYAAVKDHLMGRGIDGEKITRDAELVRNLDLDSLDTMELTLGMEERFGIEIPNAELEDLLTVGDAVSLVERKLSVSA